VVSVLAHRHAALAACGACFLTGELVRGTLLVRGAATTPGDLTLLFAVHRREATPFTPLHGILH
jgi:hypothetical protein